RAPPPPPLHYTTLFRSARGYTALGLALGVGAAAAFLATSLYSYRKRAGQEHVPGRLQSWLRVHAWVSLAGFFAVLLHSGFHADGDRKSTRLNSSHQISS